MAITRLSGGTTPPNGSDPRTFPAIWNDAVDDIEAAEAAIGVLQGEAIPTNITNPAAGEKLVYDGANWVNFEGYVFVDTVYFTSSGTFTKADFPFLRAIRVRCQAGGGGGGGATNNHRGGGGGSGGGYAESFITDIAGLDASVTVTRGAGGAGGNPDGVTGSASSFGSLVVAAGGFGGGSSASGAGGSGPLGGTGDIIFSSSSGGSGSFFQASDSGPSGTGGSSHLGGGGLGSMFSRAGGAGGLFGGGGGGGYRTSVNQPGGIGANGLIIVELFA